MFALFEIIIRRRLAAGCRSLPGHGRPRRSVAGNTHKTKLKTLSPFASGVPQIIYTLLKSLPNEKKKTNKQTTPQGLCTPTHGRKSETAMTLVKNAQFKVFETSYLSRILLIWVLDSDDFPKLLIWFFFLLQVPKAKSNYLFNTPILHFLSFTRIKQVPNFTTKIFC